LIPRRATEAAWQQLDLTDHYTGILTEPFHPMFNLVEHPTGLPAVPFNRLARGTGQMDDDLRQLPQGLVEFDDVLFDVRGVIQLRLRAPAGGPSDLIWEPFPSECRGIPVGRSFSRLRILHAGIVRGAAAGLEGKVVAVLVCHYTDGSQSPLEIVYGRHVREWEETPGSTGEVSEGKVVWRGSNPVVKALGNSLRVYGTRWDNPRPGERVTSIDYVSRLTAFAPFLIAITVE
jgi:hypothetical protein